MKRKKPKEKIGLVLTGGGMRCAYGGGAMLALAEKYKFTSPHALAAESGSVGNAYYYLARQIGIGRKMWTEYLADPKMVSPRKWMNIDYLIDEIFKKKTPLNLSRLGKTKTKYFFAVTELETGKHYFVTDKSPFNPYEVMRAAKAVPIAYGKKVRLGLKTYIDGGMSGTIEDMAKKVLETGVTTLITINCEPPKRARVIKLALAVDARIHNKGLKSAMLHDLSVPTGLCPPGGSARSICITPSTPLNMSLWSNSRTDLIKAFNLGYHDVIQSKELKRLFKTAA